jgi:hypothetical protein
MIVHLVDGTYELFRHFSGLRRFDKGVDRPYGAVAGVLQTVLQMIENGDTYLGVATDHVIPSALNSQPSDPSLTAAWKKFLIQEIDPQKLTKESKNKKIKGEMVRPFPV